MQKIIIILLFIGLLSGDVVIADKGEGESDSGFLTSLPPDAPALNSPANEATQLPDTITVIWHSQVHAASYTLQVSGVIDFSDLFVSKTGTDTVLTLSGFEKSTTYYWRVSASNVAGEGVFSDVWSFTTSSPSAVNRKISSTPKRYALLPVYPNPFNPKTTVTYHLPEQAEVSLVIYNSMGQSVQELVSGNKKAGEYMVTWDGRDYRGAPVTSGVYICLFKSGSHVFTQKILLMR